VIKLTGVIKRRRIKTTGTFSERLQKAAKDAREAANRLPACRERDALLAKAKQLETAAHVDELMTSPARHSAG
jgi:hypothetical protein